LEAKILTDENWQEVRENEKKFSKWGEGGEEKTI
jgi:hypothetical protein